MVISLVLQTDSMVYCVVECWCRGGRGAGTLPVKRGRCIDILISWCEEAQQITLMCITQHKDIKVVTVEAVLPKN